MRMANLGINVGWQRRMEFFSWVAMAVYAGIFVYLSGGWEDAKYLLPQIQRPFMTYFYLFVGCAAGQPISSTDWRQRSF